MRTPRRRASPVVRKSPPRAHSPLQTPRRDVAKPAETQEHVPDTPALTSAQPPLPLSSFDLLPAEMQVAARDQSVVAAPASERSLAGKPHVPRLRIESLPVAREALGRAVVDDSSFVRQGGDAVLRGVDGSAAAASVELTPRREFEPAAQLDLAPLDVLATPSRVNDSARKSSGGSPSSASHLLLDASEAKSADSTSAGLHERLGAMEMANAQMRVAAREMQATISQLHAENGRLRARLLEADSKRTDPVLQQAVTEAEAAILSSPPGSTSPRRRGERFSLLAGSRAALRRGPSRIPSVRAASALAAAVTDKV